MNRTNSHSRDSHRYFGYALPPRWLYVVSEFWARLLFVFNRRVPFRYLPNVLPINLIDCFLFCSSEWGTPRFAWIELSEWSWMNTFSAVYPPRSPLLLMQYCPVPLPRSSQCPDCCQISHHSSNDRENTRPLIWADPFCCQYLFLAILITPSYFGQILLLI